MISDLSMPVAASKNLLQITHRQNVRFSGKSDVDAKAETVTSKYLSPTNMMKVTDRNASTITKNNASKNEVISASEELNIIGSVILTRINEVDMEIAIKKKSIHARTSGKLSFTLSDEIIAFITVC